MKTKIYVNLLVIAFAIVAACTPCHAQETNAANTRVPPLKLTEKQKERIHTVHYQFGHKQIPEFVYKHTVNFREALAGTDKEFAALFAEALTNIWNAAWSVKETVVPLGLKSELVELPIIANEPNVKGFLITFPEPPQYPDNYFAFIFVDRQKNLRYLTYERTLNYDQYEDGGAVLCGWNPDGSRANYNVFGGSSRGAFSKVLKIFLQSSEKGAEIKPKHEWNPNTETFPKTEQGKR